MNPLSRTILLPAGMLLATCCCLSAQEERQPATSAEAAPGQPTDEPVAAWRRELLDFAFAAASGLPTEPHQKTRCRLQEAVVSEMLQLGQPVQARKLGSSIGNWRRGVVYAEYARYCAERGFLEEAKRYTGMAMSIAAAVMQDDNPQAWRRDRIRSRLVEAMLLMDEPREAAKLQVQLVDSESRDLARRTARGLDQARALEFLRGVDRVCTNGDFDQVRAALAAAAEVHDVFYGDDELREAAARRVATGYARLPLMVRIELLGDLAEDAIGHGDAEGALGHIDAALALTDKTQWRPQHEVPIRARLAALLHRAGSAKRAEQQLRDAEMRFADGRQMILDIECAETLLAVAEAYVALGRQDRAMLTWRRALEEAQRNPNSRPRVEDLVGICISLVQMEVEPDAALEQALRHAEEQLGAPW
jgi:hypothetical protein